MTNPPNQELHRIALTAIIFREDWRFLLLRRAYDKKVWPGKWTLPGGGFETNDYLTMTPTHVGETHQWYGSLRRGLEREVFEETGLEIDTPWLVCDLAFIRPDGVSVVVLSYAADLRGEDKVVLNEESVEFAWVTLDEAAAYDLIDGIEAELETAVFQKLRRKR